MSKLTIMHVWGEGYVCISGIEISTPKFPSVISWQSMVAVTVAEKTPGSKCVISAKMVAE